MQLSIVILTWNQLQALTGCLAALEELYARDTVEIIVIDNGSTDGTCEFVASTYPRIHVISNVENKGVAYGRNQGISAAIGEKILLLDNDTLPNTAAIDAMCLWLDRTPTTGIVACRLVSPEGITQDSFKPYPGLWIKISNVLCRNRKYVVPDKILHPDYVIGACQMFRRSLIDSIGLLDEHIFYGPEDADFCLRSIQAGYEVTYLPNVSIVHDWRRATTHNLLSPLAQKHIKALLYFYKKHSRWF